MEAWPGDVLAEGTAQDPWGSAAPGPAQASWRQGTEQIWNTDALQDGEEPWGLGERGPEGGWRRINGGAEQGGPRGVDAGRGGEFIPIAVLESAVLECSRTDSSPREHGSYGNLNEYVAGFVRQNQAPRTGRGADPVQLFRCCGIMSWKLKVCAWLGFSWHREFLSLYLRYWQI